MGVLEWTSLIEMAKSLKIKLPSYTINGLKELVFKDTYQNLGEYLSGFQYTCSILRDLEALERAAYELAIDNQNEGVNYIEVRFAPQLLIDHRKKDLTIENILKSVNKGLERAKKEYNAKQEIAQKLKPEFNYGIISCAMRMFGPKGFSPYYSDLYQTLPNLKDMQVIVLVNLRADFSIDFEKLKDVVNSKTKAIILNSPHNPTGKCLTQEDLNEIWEIIKNKNIYIISDEVYQHIIFDQKRHISPFNDERMRERTFAISSFGKSFHITGWKVGYCIASINLTKEFRKIHQYITFSTMGAAQLAISDIIDNKFDEVTNLASFYEQKRDVFRHSLKQTEFKLLPCEGSFFQLVDYTNLSDMGDLDFCKELIIKHQLAAIPLSSFYKVAPKQKIIRFCFAKDNDILENAFKNL